MNVVFLGHPEPVFEDEPIRGEFLEPEDDITLYLASDEKHTFVAKNGLHLKPFMSSIYSHDVLRKHTLLVPWQIEHEMEQHLRTMFDRVVTRNFPMWFLPYEQIIEILCCTKNPGEYIIGASRWSYEDRVMMYQGNINPMLVPEEWFIPNPVSEPNFKRIKPVDWGQGLQLGSDYEVASRHLVQQFGQL